MKKGQQSSSKTRTNKKPRRWDDPNYVQIKSNMLSFATTIDNIRQRLEQRNDVLALLSKTPFWTLIEAYIQQRLTKAKCMKSNYDIVRLIQVYDTKTKKFKFNDGGSEMKSQDVMLYNEKEELRKQQQQLQKLVKEEAYHKNSIQLDVYEEKSYMTKLQLENDQLLAEKISYLEIINEKEAIKAADNEKEEEATKTDHADHEEQEENKEDDDFVITLKDWTVITQKQNFSFHENVDQSVTQTKNSTTGAKGRMSSADLALDGFGLGR
ncbi:hypothetical protein ACE6H2_002141 [Prunus campanulata]